MTREEAIKRYTNKDEKLISPAIKVIINNIYDDFESRTCEHCKHNKEIVEMWIFCDAKVYENGSKMLWHLFSKDFGCNHFEPKTNP